MSCLIVEDELGVELAILPDLESRRRAHLSGGHTLTHVSLNDFIRFTERYEDHPAIRQPARISIHPELFIRHLDAPEVRLQIFVDWRFGNWVCRSQEVSPDACPPFRRRRSHGIQPTRIGKVFQIAEHVLKGHQGYVLAKAHEQRRFYAVGRITSCECDLGKPNTDGRNWNGYYATEQGSFADETGRVSEDLNSLVVPDSEINGQSRALSVGFDVDGNRAVTPEDSARSRAAQ